MSKWNQYDYETTKLLDRGNIKWTAMMLSEHRLALHDWDHRQYDVEPPSYDEYELAELAEKLARAKYEGAPVPLRYWKSKRYHDVIGIIKRIDPIHREVLIVIDDDDIRWIPAVHIVAVD